MKKTTTPRVAYFSMEIALEPDIPTYSGGLGILAGDTLRSAADLGVPLVAVTLAYRKGYFRQILDSAGNQFEQTQDWDPEQLKSRKSSSESRLRSKAARFRFAPGSTSSPASPEKLFRFICSTPTSRKTPTTTAR